MKLIHEFASGEMDENGQVKVSQYEADLIYISMASDHSLGSDSQDFSYQFTTLRNL